jgi:hypothetical protein
MIYEFSLFLKRKLDWFKKLSHEAFFSWRMNGVSFSFLNTHASKKED